MPNDIARPCASDLRLRNLGPMIVEAESATITQMTSLDFMSLLPLGSIASAKERRRDRSRHALGGGYWGFFAFASPSIPTQVVDPSVSLAAVLQGTALTVFVEM